MKFFYAVSILSGTIIGAGLFALPHITMQVGFKVVLFYLLFLGLISICVHHFFGELALKTEDNKRLPGFAEEHLGKRARNIALFSNSLGLLGAVLAYTILGGQFLNGLLEPTLGGSITIYTLIYFGIGSAFVFFGIKAIEKVEFLGVVGFVMVLILILVRGWPEINMETFLELGEGIRGDLFLPYGVVLFSLWGAALIPEMEEMLKGQKEKLKKAIPLGILIPIITYIVFIMIVVGITGVNTSDEAILGLMSYLDNGVVGLAVIFGLLATFTSFVALALTLKKILWYDLGFSEKLSWAIITFVPLTLFLLGIDNYIYVISFIGAMLLAIDAILITVMYQKYKPSKYKILTYPIILIFILGVVYNIIYNKDVILGLID